MDWRTNLAIVGDAFQRQSARETTCLLKQTIGPPKQHDWTIPPVTLHSLAGGTGGCQRRWELVEDGTERILIPSTYVTFEFYGDIAQSQDRRQLRLEFERAGRCLDAIPSNLMTLVWQNWPGGFDSVDHEGFWLNAVYELAFRELPLLSAERRVAPGGVCRVEDVEVIRNDGLSGVPDEVTHWYSVIENIADASNATVQILTNADDDWIEKESKRSIWPFWGQQIACRPTLSQRDQFRYQLLEARDYQRKNWKELGVRSDWDGFIQWRDKDWEALKARLPSASQEYLDNLKNADSESLKSDAASWRRDLRRKR